jgi:hypothetical protein
MQYVIYDALTNDGNVIMIDEVSDLKKKESKT